MKISTLLSLAASVALAASSHAQLLISEYLANPAGTDSPFEFVELIATKDIDFSATPFSVVFVNNGTATPNGWIAGADLTYGFNITAGSVARGDVVYVGGSGMAPTGPKLRVINTATTPGDGFGNAAAGVLGNGGANADGIAVFNASVGSLTPATVPIDAIFFGTGVGASAVSGGTEGYELPNNDHYSGGKLQANSFVAPDPPSAQYTAASGAYDISSDTWMNPRTFSLTPTLTDGSSSIVLVPEPTTWAILGLCFLGLIYQVRRKG